MWIVLFMIRPEMYCNDSGERRKKIYELSVNFHSWQFFRLYRFCSTFVVILFIHHFYGTVWTIHTCFNTKLPLKTTVKAITILTILVLHVCTWKIIMTIIRLEHNKGNCGIALHYTIALSFLFLRFTFILFYLKHRESKMRPQLLWLYTLKAKWPKNVHLLSHFYRKLDTQMLLTDTCINIVNENE